MANETSYLLENKQVLTLDTGPGVNQGGSGAQGWAETIVDVGRKKVCLRDRP